MPRSTGDERRGRARRAFADQLRETADRIEAGDLPAKGELPELARKVDKGLDELRPYRDPRARSRQAKHLAAALSRRAKTEVALRYEPTKHRRTGKPGYYVVLWDHGPTRNTMRTFVDEVMAGGRFDLIDAETLGLHRDGGDWPEIAALLQHVDDGGDWAFDRRHQLEAFARRLWADIDYPEKLADRWRPQLGALSGLVLEHWRRDQRYRSMFDFVAEKLTELGWPGTRDWLDQIVADREAGGAT